ncbi:MAG: hypothetical protein ACOYIB_00125 [Desulfosporosinus sp.]|jgi:hypothetical protein
MKLFKTILLVLALAAGSLSAISFTLARYSDEGSGSGKALIAKWGFSAGVTPDTLQTRSFSFDVFNGQQLAPQDRGENSFFVSGGQSMWLSIIRFT